MKKSAKKWEKNILRRGDSNIQNQPDDLHSSFLYLYWYDQSETLFQPIFIYFTCIIRRNYKCFLQFTIFFHLVLCHFFFSIPPICNCNGNAWKTSLSSFSSSGYCSSVFLCPNSIWYNY